MKTKTKKELPVAVQKITRRIEASGLQKGHICERLDIAQQTLSNFLGGKDDYVTESMIKRLNEYLDTVTS